MSNNPLSKSRVALAVEEMQQVREQCEDEELNAGLWWQGRAHKLLLKGKPFIVIANDEVYFTSVYIIIRESEKAKGTWTDKCEEQFQELTHWDDIAVDSGNSFPYATPELYEVFREQRRMFEIKDKIKSIATKLRKCINILEEK